jgi:hypothetical protein
MSVDRNVIAIQLLPPTLSSLSSLLLFSPPFSPSLSSLSFLLFFFLCCSSYSSLYLYSIPPSFLHPFLIFFCLFSFIHYQMDVSCLYVCALCCRKSISRIGVRHTSCRKPYGTKVLWSVYEFPTDVYIYTGSILKVESRKRSNDDVTIYVNNCALTTL